MHIEQTKLPGVLILTPKRHSDNRGFFSECWNSRTYAENGIEIDFVQDNHSFNNEVGVIRGMHFQAPPHSQIKLVRCGHGLLYDVVVDVRVGSPTYGEWIGGELSFENGRQMLVPHGCLHGFMTLTPNTEIIYKCSDYYAPSADGGVRFDDPDIGIDWPLGQITPILSEKDQNAPLLKDFKSPFTYEEAAS